MKKEIYIIIASALFVLFVAYIFFDSNYNLTGYAVYDDNQTSSLNSTAGINATKDIALNEIDNSIEIIKEMQLSNFSIVYIDDTLIQAKLVLKQVDYAEILRGNVKTNDSEKFKAQQALSIIGWKDLTYNNVLILTNEIKSRKQQAFEIYDTITITELTLQKYEQKQVYLNEANDYLSKAKKAFYEDRYDEAKDFLTKTRESIDKNSSELSMLGDLKRGLLSFFQKYWIYILLLLVIIGIFVYFSYKKIRINLLEDKIKKMKAEQLVLVDLIKRAQTERFKENKISGIVYNIRIKKYNERQNQIKEELPVLEDKLKRFKDFRKNL